MIAPMAERRRRVPEPTFLICSRQAHHRSSIEEPMVHRALHADKLRTAFTTCSSG